MNYTLLIVGILGTLMIGFAFINAGAGDLVNENNSTYNLCQRGDSWNKYYMKNGEMVYESYGHQVNIEDQREKGVYHPFEDVVKFYEIDGKVYLNITNYYLDEEGFNPYYAIFELYLLDYQNNKYTINSFDNLYNIDFEFIIKNNTGEYHFYPTFDKLPTVSLSDTQVLNKFGYKLVRTNMASSEFIFEDMIFIRLDDLDFNNYKYTINDTDLLIEVADKIEGGKLEIDPVVTLSSVYEGYIEKDGAGAYSRTLTYGIVGCITPTPTDPPI